MNQATQIDDGCLAKAVTIRKANREDAIRAFDIRRMAILHQCKGHYPNDALESWANVELSERFLSVVEERFYLAIQNDQIIGTGMVDIDTGAIDAVFVDPDHIGKGAGRMIVNFLENIARKHKIQLLKLESTLNAAPFYRACGFEGKELSQYVTQKGARLDCIPMIKALVSTGV